jgi:L-aspartate oxidase
MPQQQWQRTADVVVVGSGAAGISVALTAAAAGLRVLMVTKDLVGGATPLAQGGLAAALGAGDTPAAHVSDTLVAGAGLCSPDVVAALAESAPGAIGWLTGLGARLETRDLRLEGGHSAHRIVHSGDDATGAEVHRTLLAALLASEIEIIDRTVALDLLLGETDGTRGTRGTRQAVAGAGMDGAGIGAGTHVTDQMAAANADPVGALVGELVPAHPASVGWAADGGSGSADAWPTQRPVAQQADAVAGEQAVAGLLCGVIGADGVLTPGIISAPAVVIAAGGLGQAFGTTSNPAGATGDGIAIAARAGAVLRDLEFVQFHPTVLWLPDASGQCPLITEALRGAGAVLRDLDGTPLMAGQDPRGDLAPRDVVAARMAEVIAAASASEPASEGASASTGHVWLDATALGRDLLEDGFPTVTAACRKHGIDPVTDLIPVAPGAHYSCGGILADLDGRTSIPGLYAAGEAASTGVQGANRLASNSVTEAIIAGRRTGRAIANAGGTDDQDRGSKQGTAPETREKSAFRRALHPPFSGRFGDRGSATANRAAHGPRSQPGPDRRELAQAMSRYAGVMRDADGLAELLRVIAAADETARRELAAAEGWNLSPDSAAAAVARLSLDLAAVEAANLRVVSRLIAAGALRRAESRGCHRRRDAAGTAAAPWHTLARWDGQELVLTEEEL